MFSLVNSIFYSDSYSVGTPSTSLYSKLPSHSASKNINYTSSTINDDNKKETKKTWSEAIFD